MRKVNPKLKLDLLRIRELELPSFPISIDNMSQKERQQLKQHLELHYENSVYMRHIGSIHNLEQIPILSYEEFLLNYGNIFVPTDPKENSERICNKSPRYIYDLYIRGYDEAPRVAKFMGWQSK